MEFDVLYRELAQGSEILRQLVSGVSQAEARLRPAPESWSILEVVCHLYDEEREDFRAHLDLVLHHPDGIWSAIDPQGWVTVRNYNERDLGEMLEAFVAERQRSLAWLRGLEAPNWEAQFSNEYGSIRAGDVLCAWAAHDNLHTRQLVELRRARVELISAPYEVRYAGDW
jgi:hypothetical protein